MKDDRELEGRESNTVLCSKHLKYHDAEKWDFCT